MATSNNQPPKYEDYTYKAVDTRKRPETPEYYPLWGSCRFIFTVCSFLTTLNLIFMRFNISFALVCMVKDKIENETSSLTNESNWMASQEERNSCVLTTQSKETKMFDLGEFDWSTELQGRILSGFFYGYTVSQCFGGWFSDRFGGKLLFVAGNLMQSICTLLMPLAARVDPNVMFGLRIIQGIVCGLSLPAMYQLYSKWASPEERTKLMGIAYTGFPLANCLMFPLSGFLCESGIDGGWPAIFYVTGGIGLTTSLWFIFVVYDTPDKHPRISENERKWLNSVCVQKQKGPLVIPWRSMIFSAPIYAYAVAHFCQSWGFITMSNYLPQIMKEIFYFDIASNGVLSALPFLGGFLCRLGIALAFYPILKRIGWSLTNYRKFNHLLGTFLPALGAVCITMMTCHEKYLAVVVFTLGNAISDVAFTGSYLLSFLEIAPAYVGLLTGFTNTIACLPGVLAPMFVGRVTSDRTKEGWMIVLYVMAGMYFIGGTVYALIGSSELQPWAKQENENKNEKESNKTENIEMGYNSKL